MNNLLQFLKDSYFMKKKKLECKNFWILSQKFYELISLLWDNVCSDIDGSSGITVTHKEDVELSCERAAAEGMCERGHDWKDSTIRVARANCRKTCKVCGGNSTVWNSRQ